MRPDFLPNRCADCADAFRNAAWNFCPACGKPVRMPCPECGGGPDRYIPLRYTLPDGTGGGPVAECAAAHLLKNCPSCGKLHAMAAHVCDEPGCSAAPLAVPPSSWADADGGVTRRRFVRGGPVWAAIARPSNGNDGVRPVLDLPVPGSAGDTLISAYGRLYFDRDPYVSRCAVRPADAGTFRLEHRPCPDPLNSLDAPTGIAAHSGFVAVLGTRIPGTAAARSADTATLLEAQSLELVTTIDEPGITAQIIADDLWWFFGHFGATVRPLRAAATDAGPTPCRWEGGSLAGTLPPVRLGSRTVWTVLPSGHWFVLRANVEASAVECVRQGRLGEEEAVTPFAACLCGPVDAPSHAVILSNREDHRGGIHCWKLTDITGNGDQAATADSRLLSERLLETWATDAGHVYVAGTGSNRITPFKPSLLKRDLPPITLPPAVNVQRIAAIDHPNEEYAPILIESVDGRFEVAYESGRRAAFASTWQAGNKVVSWTPWGSDSLAVITEADGMQRRLSIVRGDYNTPNADPEAGGAA